MIKNKTAICFSSSNIRQLLSIAVLLLLFVQPALAEGPLQVGVRMKVDQITSINQKKENFGVVATLMMERSIPELAAKAGEQVFAQRMYKASEFVRLMNEQHLMWSAHSFHNVQGRVDYQNRLVAVDPDGNVRYLARFTATFQAPDFDFRRFPFDEQYFHLTLDSIAPETVVTYRTIEKFSGLGGYPW